MEAAAAGDHHHHHGLRRGTWSDEEDRLLRRCILTYGEGRWHLVPARAGLNRCRKSCRLRWLNYLKPNLKRGGFERGEVDLIIRMHKLLGNRWSLIAGRLPGRTANDVKNYWNTHHKDKEKKITTPTLSFPCKTRSNTESVVVMNKTFCPNEGKITKANIIRPQPQALSKGFCWAKNTEVANSSFVWAQELKSFLDDDIDFPATAQLSSSLVSNEVKVNEHNNNNNNNNSTSCSNDHIMKLMMSDHQEDNYQPYCLADASIWDLFSDHLDS